MCSVKCFAREIRRDSWAVTVILKWVYVCESEGERLLKQVCVSTCWWCVIIHYLRTCCWLSAESKSQSHLEWAPYRNITLITTATVAQPAQPMRGIMILYLIFDLNKLFDFIQCTWMFIYMYCPKSSSFFRFLSRWEFLQFLLVIPHMFNSQIRITFFMGCWTKERKRK